METVTVNPWTNPVQRFERRGARFAFAGGEKCIGAMAGNPQGPNVHARCEAFVEILNERATLRELLDEASALIGCVDTSMSERAEFVAKVDKALKIAQVEVSADEVED